MIEKKGDGRRIMCGKVASGWIVVRIDMDVVISA